MPKPAKDSGAPTQLSTCAHIQKKKKATNLGMYCFHCDHKIEEIALRLCFLIWLPQILHFCAQSVWRTIACICHLYFRSIRCLWNIWTFSLKNAMQSMAQGNDVWVYIIIAEIRSANSMVLWETLIYSFFFHPQPLLEYIASSVLRGNVRFRNPIISLWKVQIPGKQIPKHTSKHWVRTQHEFLSKQLLSRLL